QSDSRYLDVEIRSDEGEICSEISATSSDKHSWCKIARNSDLCSATMENKSSNTILVDGAEVGNGDTAVIKDGSEIIPGPDREG
ncbi:E3 ubiquitin-protein ligase CHFR-like, partial [Trifolium medium]|nr:E3 ubiquitin-protein ligase CHFR-like [Trifolium medium]